MLLTQKFSDDFSLGDAEQHIPEDLRSYVIIYKIDLTQSDLEAMVQRFTYSEGSLDKGRARIIIAEYLLEDFLRKVGREGDFDDVFIYRRYPGSSFARAGYRFTAVEDGMRIQVYNDATREKITDIPNLAQIRMGIFKHFVICDCRTAKSPLIKLDERIKAAKAYLSLPYKIVLSYMLVYPQDVFIDALQTAEQWHKGKRQLCRSDITEFLRQGMFDIYEPRFCLVYSATSSELISLGKHVLEIVKERGLHTKHH